jgi:hypothetical protein
MQELSLDFTERFREPRWDRCRFITLCGGSWHSVTLNNLHGFTAHLEGFISRT